MKDRWESFKPSILPYSVMLGAGVAVLAVMKGAMMTIDFFTTLDFKDVAYWAYIAGLASSSLLWGIGITVNKLLVIQPKPVYEFTLKRVQKDSQVIEMLGADLKTGDFQAISLVQGGLRLGSDEVKANHGGWLKYWRPRRLQLMFQITGPKGHGMCSAEVEKDFKGRFRFNSLAVTSLEQDGNQEQVVLEGDKNDVIFKNVIRLR